jgi:tetratricopeptide (TPR) repeat protein
MSHDDDLAAVRRLISQGDLAAAARLCQQALSSSPHDVPATALLAKIARRTGSVPAAERLLRHTLQYRTGLETAELWLQLGLTLSAAHRLREAAQAYRQAVSVDPRMAAAWSNLSAVHYELEEWTQAEHCARRSLELVPASRQALVNLGQSLQAQGDSTASGWLERAVELHPAYALAHWNLSLALLSQGDFARGWQHYEWREAAAQVAFDKYPQQRWRGESLAGQTLLVHGEQGLGDEILFASCFDEMQAGAKRCLLVCDPRLVPLFRRSFPAAGVIGHRRRKDRSPAPMAEPVDYQIPSGSPPQFFRRQPADFPQRQSYLRPDGLLVEQWRDRFEAFGTALRVGISWRAGGQAAEHRKRSINLALWAPLLAVPGIEWINLQYGDTTAERGWAGDELGVTIRDWPQGDPLIDLDGFAARLAALDLVISVGNATVHLAGALGVPAWAILPHIPNWRWGLNGDRSIWYASVRLVRQAAAGAWEPVFNRLADDLRSWSAERSPTAQHSAPSRAPRPMGGELKPAPVAAEVVDVHAALTEAAAHFDAGRFEPAEVLCRAVLTLAPRQGRALQLLAQLARRSGRIQLALDSIARALAAQELPELYCELAAVLVELGQQAEAVRQLERALAIDPAFLPAETALRQLRTPWPAAAPAPHWPRSATQNLSDAR